jgi:excinuclease UvrABC nuclease subunit
MEAASAAMEFETAAALRDATVGLTRMDRARLVEILDGPEAAEALLTAA